MYYRIPNEPFTFTPFAFNKNVKLLDCWLIPYIFLFIGPLIPKKKRNIKIQTEGFEVDEPIRITEVNDLQNHIKFIKELADKIRNTESPTGSFSIGIVASWGSGKTSFLKTLMTEFKSHEYIVIELNAWKSNTTTQIITSFFNSLKEKLEDFSFTINSKIDTYAKSLLKGVNISSGVNINEIFEPLLATNNDDQYQILNKEIKRIDKKIIVAIDDLDRLDKNEVYEVIRLIRNAADFANVFFIVTYDRNYILNAIEDINTYQPFIFLEKIFQIEFVLPGISGNSIQNEVTKRLWKILSTKDRESYNKMLSQELVDLNDVGVNLTLRYLLNMRDVIRFVNSFTFNYLFVKDEVVFNEFYNLQLISFKHPEIYVEIYRKYLSFFTVSAFDNFSSKNTYHLLTLKDEKKCELEKFLSLQKAVYKITEKEIELIVHSFLSLFSEPANTYSRNNTPLHLSVIKPSMFDRYFILGIEGKLSNIEFSKIRELPSEEFNDKLKELSKSQKVSLEIREKLQDIIEFDDKADLEKIFAATFFLTRLEDLKTDKYTINPDFYNMGKLAVSLGNKNNIKFYKNDTGYKDFLHSILITRESRFLFVNKFVNYLLKSGFYSVQNVLTIKDIELILLKSFINVISTAKTLTIDLRQLFYNCRMRKEQDRGNGITDISYPLNEEAKVVFRKFILEKYLDAFIQVSIHQPDPFKNQYSLTTEIRDVFTSNDLFVEVIRGKANQSIAQKGLLKIYELLNTDEYMNGVPMEILLENHLI